MTITGEQRARLDRIRGELVEIADEVMKREGDKTSDTVRHMISLTDMMELTIAALRVRAW